jgi:Domain of unknown function (DUF309)
MRPQQELFNPMDELLKSGINLFNNRQFFACHEVLEAAWTPVRRQLFLRAGALTRHFCYPARLVAS